MSVAGASATIIVLLAIGPGPAHAGQWLAGDLHVHTTYSHDSYGGPGDDNTEGDEAYTLGHPVERQFRLARSRGLDYLAITDHDDVRSHSDPGFGTSGVVPVPGYEASFEGHTQMLGATRVYDHRGESRRAIRSLVRRLRRPPDRGVFQVNHPALGSTDFPHDPDWGYGYKVVPDTVETWNISQVYQPPFPSASSNDDAIRYWEGWLDRGRRVAATGGSDNHWVSTTALQGVGQPTTWVFARGGRGARAVLGGLRGGRTFISHQPPGFGGPRLLLEADRNGNGDWESMVGDVVPRRSALRIRTVHASGSLLRVVTDGGREALSAPVTGDRFERRFAVPARASWVRAELVDPDLAQQRRALCDELVGAGTTYCRNRLGLVAMTSAIYLGSRRSWR